MSDPQWIVLIVAALRVAELVYAARNSRHLLAAGGREVGADHYPLFVLLHGGWLAALFFLVPADAPIHALPLAIFGVLLAVRAWVILSLGRYWTTRIITLPGTALVRSGPYRFVRHPNYLVVVGEIAILPLVFGAWPIALVFSLLNAALLWQRIRLEDTALASRRAIRS
ncbi:MAG TPA: isoprenylcysteine carboxylmethyltransferase family protein [Alphaproteobacteria bacterium]|jgi:methyltransferase|nr:isoprenylcysteine carboxylmethyltransferase family protein [Alphaproteobacteria bacterium]